MQGVDPVGPAGQRPSSSAGVRGQDLQAIPGMVTPSEFDRFCPGICSNLKLEFFSEIVWEKNLPFLNKLKDFSVKLVSPTGKSIDFK